MVIPAIRVKTSSFFHVRSELASCLSIICIYLSIHPSIYHVYLLIYPLFYRIYLSMYLSIHWSIYLSIHPSINWSIISVCLSDYLSIYLGRPGGSVVKNLPASPGDSGSIPGLGRSPGEGNCDPLQYSCLENPMDRGACWATVHGVTKESDSTYQLNNSMYLSIHWSICLSIYISISCLLIIYPHLSIYLPTHPSIHHVYLQIY